LQRIFSPQNYKEQHKSKAFFASKLQ